MTEPARGAPRSIRGQPTTEFVRTSNHAADPLGKQGHQNTGGLTQRIPCNRPTDSPKTEAVNTHRAVIAKLATRPLQRRPLNRATKKQNLNAREAVPVRGTLVLARERTGRSVFVSGFARRRGSHIRGSGEHRAFGAPMNENCTLWTLRVER